jgi:hypothetical protein
MLDAILALTAQGFNVIPCNPRSKEPAGLLVPNGLKNATANPATIKRWFGNDQNYNVAVRCGVASGIWVLDVDMKHGKDGEAALAELVAKHGPLPETRQSQSGTGGRHFWFRCQSPIPLSVDHIAVGIDVRADNS